MTPQTPIPPDVKRMALAKQAQRVLAQREFARRDLSAFVPLVNANYHAGPFQRRLLDELQRFVLALEARKNPVLIIQAPPRHGKTLAASTYLPAWFLGRNPDSLLLQAAYGQDYADDLGRDVRTVVSSPIYADLFPKAVPLSSRTAVNEYTTLAGGTYTAVGVGGAITGRGGHLLNIDDPVKSEEVASSPRELDKIWAWYQSVFRTRAMEYYGILIVMTRWSPHDLAGRVIDLARTTPDADQPTVISFPAECIDPTTDLLGRPRDAALDPVRYPTESLRRTRATLTPRQWSALYQQQPLPPTGTFFDATTIEAAITPLSRYPHTKDLTVYIASDLAVGTTAKNDFTCHWPFGVDAEGTIWFLPDIVHARLGPFDSIERLLDLATTLSPRELIIEDGHLFRGMRDTLTQRMRERQRLYFIAAPWPTKDKLARAEPLRAWLQQGRVRFPDTPFVRNVFMPEAIAFGSGAAGVHDDTIDPCAMGLSRIQRTLSSRPRDTTAMDGAPLSSGPAPYSDGKLTWDELQARRTKTITNDSLVRVPRRLNGHDRHRRV